MISVIIPVYNVVHYLSRCLESVCASRYSELEIICIDDGSTDGSSAMLDEWAKRDSRIRVVHTENHGISCARNAGLNLASGDYIAFIDSDDYVSEWYFELLLKEIRRYDAGIAVCGYLRTAYFESGSRETPAYTVSVLTKEKMLSCHKTKSYAWGKLYRRDLLETVRFDPKLKIEDAPFNADVVRRNGAFDVVYLDAQLYFYFVRADSLMSAIGADEYLKLHEYYADCSRTEKNPVLQQTFLTESVKRGLSAEFRYWMDRQDEEYRDARKKTISVARKCRRHGLLFCIFAHFPVVYKIYLIMRDPTICDWKRRKGQ